MLNATELGELAGRLWAAERERVPIGPLVRDYPGLSVADAYAIQLHNIRRRSAGVVGHKVGLSSKAMQEMMGVGEPDYGHLLADMRLFEDLVVDASRYCFPRVEIEVAFLLGDDLPGEGCTEDDVLAATEALAPSIELIDSRIIDWKISLPDTIADNASSAGFVVGPGRVPPKDIDPRGIAAVLRRGGEVVAAGRSDAVLGNPVTAVAWLARKVARFGVRLRAGHLIMPGACARAVDVHPGDEFRAEFSGLGEVRLTFAAPADSVHRGPRAKQVEQVKQVEQAKQAERSEQTERSGHAEQAGRADRSERVGNEGEGDG
ncbi:2-keto-4-pentenoate hydratase [Actinoplanes derwentensis]|uniref:2-keto-4-pentenoate hydratase n=1 Tax=Actinoplanes derwentensis TaxID=113562 RepID=A0A1H2B2L2_9ACTN|nr:2-keto-4-pentenoate hydratase [Actinoplanes derwentensis]GID87571.1 putative hydratase/decarboxylase [Actinoplanes derwentensis]SDT52413.1 2-keto-4-pentenoate hydratase [Actinoplanes derwentensis]